MPLAAIIDPAQSDHADVPQHKRNSYPTGSMISETMQTMKIRRSISTPIRLNLSWEESWRGVDQGLVTCWERGRERSQIDPSLAVGARDGELVVLPWKGGVAKALKKKTKYGTLSYLAMWQGLRGEDLDIDTEAEPAVTCSRTAMTVVFTNNFAKYAQVEDESV